MVPDHLYPVTMSFISVMLAQDERERALGVCRATVMGDWQWESSPLLFQEWSAESLPGEAGLGKPLT